MAAENKQSVQVANLDYQAFIGVLAGQGTGRITAGKKESAEIQSIEGFVTPTTGSTTGSYYQMVRVPADAYIKRLAVVMQGTSITTFVADLTLAISDSTIDGTEPSLQIVPSGLTTTLNAFIANPSGTSTGLTGSAALFMPGLILSSAVVGTVYEVTWGNAVNSGPGTGNGGNYTFAKSLQPLWQAAGYLTNPGGFFDIVLYETSTESETAAQILLICEFQTVSK